jgi:hypothetical protein
MEIISPSEKSRLGILLTVRNCKMKNSIFTIMLASESFTFTLFFFFDEKVQLNRNACRYREDGCGGFSRVGDFCSPHAV